MVKHLPTMRETWVRSLGRADPLEKEIATHSSTLAQKIPWMEEPGRLKSSVAKSRTQLSNLFSLHFISQNLLRTVLYLGPSRVEGRVLETIFFMFLTLCDPVHCSSPGSSVHGFLQAIILEWIAMPSSRVSSQPRDWALGLISYVSYVSCIGRVVSLPLAPPGKNWEQPVLFCLSRPDLYTMMPPCLLK